MELRQLYKQGKSIVLVLPAKYLLALNWLPHDNIAITILPDRTLKLHKLDHPTLNITPLKEE